VRDGYARFDRRNANPLLKRNERVTLIAHSI
jgi:hypothetical protein